MRSRCAGSGLTVDGRQARARVGIVALQGTDPAVLLAPPEVIRREAGKILAAYGYRNGMFQPGAGIPFTRRRMWRRGERCALDQAVH
jgi:uroporphyrinogen-III decarboxylase